MKSETSQNNCTAQPFSSVITKVRLVALATVQEMPHVLQFLKPLRASDLHSCCLTRSRVQQGQIQSCFREIASNQAKQSYRVTRIHATKCENCVCPTYLAARLLIRSARSHHEQPTLQQTQHVYPSHLVFDVVLGYSSESAPSSMQRGNLPLKITSANPTSLQHLEMQLAVFYKSFGYLLAQSTRPSLPITRGSCAASPYAASS